MVQFTGTRFTRQRNLEDGSGLAEFQKREQTTIIEMIFMSVHMIPFFYFKLQNNEVDRIKRLQFNVEKLPKH